MLASIDDGKLGPRHVVAAVCGSAASVTWLLLLTGAPVGAVQWTILIGGSLVAAALLTALFSGLLELVARPATRLRRRHRALALPVLVVVAMLVPGGVVAGLSPAPPAAPAAVCDLPVELRVLAAPSRLAYARELFDSYQQWTADGNDGCPTVSGYVYAAPPDMVLSHLRASWATGLRDVGPRPELWLPDDTSQVEYVRREIEGAGLNLRDVDDQVVAVSPVVLAVGAAAVAGHDLSEGNFTWAELLALADHEDWGLARPVPAVSVVGELATTAMYGAAELVDADPVTFARRVEARIAATLARDSYPLADTEPLLCRHRQRGLEAADTALIITEQAAHQFVRGNELGVACPAGAVPTAAAETAAPETAAAAGEATGLRLELLRPADTVTVQHPVVTLVWADRSEQQARAASDLVAWLSTDAGHAALAAVGLQPAERAQPPAPEAAARARETYQAAQQSSRVLLALHAAAAMAEPVDSEHTRYDLVLHSLEVALRLLSDRDEFGLWIFPEQPASAEEPPDEPADDPRELVPIGSADEPYQDVSRTEAALAALAGLEPDALTTPLHRTIVDAVATVGPDPNGIAAVVVVTGGEDTERDPATDQALAALGDDGVRVYVVAIGEASCLTEALAGVTGRTGGGCVQADIDTLEGQLVELFRVLRSGVGPA